MSKHATAFDLALGQPPAGLSASPWLYSELNSAILAGKLPAGTRVPSTRSLAQTCRIARGTVVGVYELLCAEGYVRAETGAGSWVASLSQRTVQTRSEGQARPPPDAGRLAQRAQPFLDFRFTTPGRKLDVSLFPFYPALDEFPLPVWRRIAAGRLRQFDAASMGNQHPLGYPPLREAIADYLRLARGISCSGAQIAIVAGVQQALDMVARLVADPGDKAIVEDPCYPGAQAALTAAGLRLAPVPVDGEGLQVAPIQACDARLAFVSPAHQAPLGVIMSAQRRIDLLAWARDHDAIVFEDDYDGEFRYSGWPVPALGARQGQESPGSRVVTFGSFTKTLFPSLRIGYVVLPQWLVGPFEGALGITTRYAEPLMQQVLFDFIVQGHYARHIHRMRGLYARRRRLLADAIASDLAPWLRIDAPGDGLATIAWLKRTTGVQAARAGLEHGIALVPLSRYVLAQRRDEGLVLGFANASEANLAATMMRMQHAMGAAQPR